MIDALVIEEIVRVGEELPIALARDIAAGCDVTRIYPVERREAIVRLMIRWGDRPQSELRTALLTAACAADRRRCNHAVELVWTGPDARVIPVRQTEQVILDLIRDATQSVLVVSYAVYRATRIRQALIEAAQRGVQIRFVTEDPEIPLGADLTQVARILHWPPERRLPDSEGKRGVLHVKCVVADRKRLFLSSANLTRNAFQLNMELGVVVTDSDLATRVDAHFDELLTRGELRDVLT